MELERTLLQEHLALQSKMTLPILCATLQEELKLPTFDYDAENATEWGWVGIDHLEINVSRPYKVGTLQKWDSTVPDGCNFGITLSVARDHPLCSDSEWSLKILVPQYAQKIADTFGIEVYHHRTWLGPGQNIHRESVFAPLHSASGA